MLFPISFLNDTCFVPYAKKVKVSGRLPWLKSCLYLVLIIDGGGCFRTWNRISQHDFSVDSMYLPLVDFHWWKRWQYDHFEFYLRPKCFWLVPRLGQIFLRQLFSCSLISVGSSSAFEAKKGGQTNEQLLNQPFFYWFTSRCFRL